MSLWLLASVTVAILAAVLTGRPWLMWLAAAYGTAVITRWLWLAT